MSTDKVTEDDDKLLWTIRDIAERLAVHRKTVSKLITKGELPVVQIGRCKRVPTQAVLDWVESQTRYNLDCVGSTVRDPKGERSCRINTPTAGIATVGSRTPLQEGGLTDLLERRKRRKPTPSNVSGG